MKILREISLKNVLDLELEIRDPLKNNLGSGWRILIPGCSG
jgi:hypothetical protein